MIDNMRSGMPVTLLAVLAFAGSLVTSAGPLAQEQEKEAPPAGGTPRDF